MSEVTRFDKDMDGSMEPTSVGRWVRSDDYDALAARLAGELEHERDACSQLARGAVIRAEAAEARVLELEAAIQGAYGWLWLVNNEPGTPNQFEPEKAAYKARKVLRALLTHEQRGDGINRAMQEHRASPSARTALDGLHQMDHEDSKT